jgi:phage tail-like protein
MANQPTEVLNLVLTYNFLVKWDGRYVAAVTSVSGLGRGATVLEYRAGGQPSSYLKIPGQTDYRPVRLERGITTDTAFEDWANLTWVVPNTQQLGDETPLASLRKPMQIELYDERGILVVRYDLSQCWPSEYTALPELSSEANGVALASMTIEHEGWKRRDDTSVSRSQVAAGPDE